MYKLITLSIIITLFTACSAPKPLVKPSWFTNPSQDSEYIYGVGEAKTFQEAQDIATISLRENLSLHVTSVFDDNDNYVEILKKSSEISNKLSLKQIETMKTKEFKGNFLVLIGIEKIKVLNKISPISTSKFNRFKLQSEMLAGKDDIQRFIALEELMASYSEVASLVGYRNILNNNKVEVQYLRNMYNNYTSLQNSINIYVLTDVGSRIFSPVIVKYIDEKNISMDKNTNVENSLRLLITSTSKEEQDYSFNKTSSLVKFTLFDKSKNILAFKQHTFIARSRKDYEDAKKQNAINMSYKVKKLGLFNFIGIK
ncbi:hypothetical protein N9A28_02300 [Sulfurimonas sp.]|nr:hypothetical protein [Sulfurimonas sp.]